MCVLMMFCFIVVLRVVLVCAKSLPGFNITAVGRLLLIHSMLGTRPGSPVKQIWERLFQFSYLASQFRY